MTSDVAIWAFIKDWLWVPLLGALGWAFNITGRVRTLEAKQTHAHERDATLREDMKYLRNRIDEIHKAINGR